MLNIKVVGSGCPNCAKLEALCKEVISESGYLANIEKVTDVNDFANLGVFMTPGLVVNDKVLSQGKIPTKSTLEHWLMDNTK
ncbi:redox-active disulfide protein 2 [hydrocarbon metagenome]|uniref:Redox-active disulfide protein 2 n=1 Tax=hydrocarbon metagenome TaxID=938273 RepID=A0A0W8FVB1_9ZZZZ